LISKHNQEIKQVTENIKNNLALLHTGEPALDIKSLTATTTTRRIPSPQPKSHVRSPLKFSFKGNLNVLFFNFIDDLSSSLMKSAEKKVTNEPFMVIEDQNKDNIQPNTEIVA